MKPLQEYLNESQAIYHEDKEQTDKLIDVFDKVVKKVTDLAKKELGDDVTVSSDKDSNMRRSPSLEGQISWRLREYKKHPEKVIVKSNPYLINTDQGFFHIKINSDKIHKGTIHVNIGYDGNDLFYSVSSGWHENKEIENKIKSQLSSAKFPEVKKIIEQK